MFFFIVKAVPLEVNQNIRLVDQEGNLASLFLFPSLILYQKLTSVVFLGSLMEKTYQFMTPGTFQRHQLILKLSNISATSSVCETCRKFTWLMAQV